MLHVKNLAKSNVQAVIEDYRESKKASANFLGSRSLNFVDKPETERAISAGALQENQ